MKSIVLTMTASIALAFAGAAGAQEDLAKKDGCLNCHAIDTKKVGPAFKDVAARFKGKADAPAMLEKKLTSGDGHPKTKASPEDAKALVKWVLSQ